MKSAVRHFVLGLSILLVAAGPASAQYLKITTDNPTDNTHMRASGTTILTLSLDTNHDRNGSVQTCNSHTVGTCLGSSGTANPLDIGSYTITLTAVGGTVTWGTYSNAMPGYADNGSNPPTSTQVEVNFGRASGFDPAGAHTLGTISVTPLTGTPGIDFARGAQPINPFGFGTGFGTECDAFNFPNTYVLADPANLCATGDFTDADGALSSSGNTPPTLTAPASVSADEGTAIPTITATATDPDAGNTLTINASGVPAFLTFSSTPGSSPRTGTITGTTGFSDAGIYNISWTVDDGVGGTNNTTTVLTINNVNRAPTLAQPGNMTVNEGSTAEQTLSASDPDGDALTFAAVTGPLYLTVLTDTPTTGTVRLVPNFTQSGTADASVRATDPGGLFDQKSFTITVNNTNRAPVLAQPNNMTVDPGATADQVITATDVDGDALTFSLTAGPSFVTVTTTTPGSGTATGNIHLAPGVADAGTHAATVTAGDATLSNSKTFQIVVNGGAVNQPPTLTQPANMTVSEGATANQTITATDPDGDALTFSKVSGPTYMTVTTTTPGTGTGTGNIHLAPGFSDAGTASGMARVSDGTVNDDKTFTITVENVNRAPTLNAVANMTVTEGATDDQAITGSDPDGDPLTFAKASGPTFMTVTTTNATTGNIHLAPVQGDAAGSPHSASVSASDGTLSDGQSFTITVNPAGGGNVAPVLTQPTSMTVNEGATADQTLTATDANGDAIAFSLVSGPSFATVTTTTPGTGTGTGTIHLAPGFSDSGTYGVTVRASDGSLGDNKTLTVTVNNVNRAPVLGAITNMTVTEGATDNQTITATDADGDALTFSKVSGPTFMTVSTTNPTTGNIHLAPVVGDAVGSPYSASVSASDGTLSDGHGFSITVNAGQPGNVAPVLVQPSDMTVNEGATADQALSATDQNGDAITFSLDSGPTFVTVTTTTPGTGTGTGNIHLAPGFSDAGTHGVTVRASDGSLNDDKSLTVTVNNVNRAPVLGAITNMTVTEGATADQTITATDPDGDPLTFSKETGPTFVTITTTTPGTGTATGLVHVAPQPGDAGTSTVQAKVSDGSLTDTRIFSVAVNPAQAVNRPPVADAGGPYTGTVGSPVSFSGTGSSDPDGDAITYAWDFDATDGITVDATGATPTHAYGAPGTFTVTLTVTDNGSPQLSDTDTATATISAGGGAFAAIITVDGGDQVIRLQSGKPTWCVDIKAVNDAFQPGAIIPSSLLATFNGASIGAIGALRDHDDEDHALRTRGDDGDDDDQGDDQGEDEGNGREFCFAKDQLRTLFASLPNGRTRVDVVITGSLQNGGTFQGTVQVVVVKGSGGDEASKRGRGHDHDAFAWASPNPLNPSTTISFVLSQPGNVGLHVYDISGRLVNTLADRYMERGIHEVMWDGTTRSGSRVSSGVYYYVLTTPERTVKSHLVVAK